MDKKISFEKAIENIDMGRGLAYSDLFHEYLDLHLSFHCNNPSKRQNELRRHATENKEYGERVSIAMKCYGDEAEDYKDPLGNSFMERVSFGQNGQFFTPKTICDFMANIMDPHLESISDPTCGSGRLLLSGLKKARKNNVEPHIHGNDLSNTCAKMTLLNLLSNSASGIVTCGDGLRLDYNNYIFYKIDRLRFIYGQQIALSTYWEYTLSNADEVEDIRQKWWKDRYMEGWRNANVIIRQHESAKAKPQTSPIEALPTEYKIDNKGQFLLF